MKLIDQRVPDGSRFFAALPKITPWESVRDHVLLLGSANVINYIDEDVACPWLDFTYRGHRFLIHCHKNYLRMFVHDPQCSDLILYEVGAHFERLVGETTRDEG